MTTMPKPPLLQSNLGPPVCLQVKVSKDAEDKSRRSRGCRKPLSGGSERRTSLDGGFKSSLNKIPHSNSHFKPKSEIENLAHYEGVRKNFKTKDSASESFNKWSKLDLSELEHDDVNSNNKETKLVLSMRQSNVLLSPRVYDSVTLPLDEAKHYATEGCFLKKSRIQQVTMGPIESDSVCDISFSSQSATNILEYSVRKTSQPQTCNRKPLKNIAHGSVHNGSLRKGKTFNLTQSDPNCNSSFFPNGVTQAGKYRTLVKKTKPPRIYPKKYTDLFNESKKNVRNFSSRQSDYSRCKDSLRKSAPDIPYHPESVLRTSTLDRMSGENDQVSKQLYEADMEHLVNQRFLEGLKASENSFFYGERLIRNQQNEFEGSVVVRSEDTFLETDDNSQLYNLSETESNDELTGRENSNLSDSLHVSELDDSVSLETEHRSKIDCGMAFDCHVSIPTDQYFDYEQRKKQVHFKNPISSCKGILSLEDLGLDSNSEDYVKHNFEAFKKDLHTENGKEVEKSGSNRFCKREKVQNVSTFTSSSFHHAAIESEKEVDKFVSVPLHSSFKSTNSQISHHSADNARSYGSGSSNMRRQLHRNFTAVPGSLTTSILATKAQSPRIILQSRNTLEQAGATNIPKSLIYPSAIRSEQSNNALRQLRMMKIVDKSLPQDRCNILLKARYFRMWQQNVRLLKIIRNKENLKIVKAASFYSLTTTTKYFLAWRTHINNNRREAEVICRHHLMKKGFAALLWSVRARKLKKERVQLSRRKLKFTKYFRKWCNRYQERRLENIKTTFCRWKLQFRNKVITDMFDKRRKRIISMQVLFFWKERFLYSSHLKIASEHYNGFAIRKSWQMWKIFAAEKVVLKSQAEVAQIKHETSVLSKCMKRWKQTAIQTQYVKIYYSKKVNARSMANWKHFTSLAKIRHQKEILSARTLRSEHLLQHHFSGWIQEMKMKNFKDGVNEKITRSVILLWKTQLQKRRMICAEIQAHHNHTLIKLSFSALSLHRKNCQTRRGQGVQLLRNFSVRRFMSSWHQFTMKKAMLRNKQKTYCICSTKKKLHASFENWRIRLKSILDEQQKQHQWTLHCVRKAADTWLHLLKLEQNETKCGKLIIKFQKNRLTRGFGIWKKRIQFEDKLCERAKSSRIVLLRIKMRRILRCWNIRAQESLNMRPVIEKLNRKRVARCFDAFILIRNRQKMKAGMRTQIMSNFLRQCFNKWKQRLNEKNQMKSTENHYHTMLSKRALKGWIKYVSRCHDSKLAAKQREQALLLQTFYIWVTTMASRQLQASKKLHDEFIRRSNAQFLFQSWRSAAKHRLENEEKEVLRFRKQHDLALKKSFFSIWTSSAMKHAKATKFATRNTEQRIKTMLLSWHFITTENLVKKMERFTSSIKSLRRQEIRPASKAVQSEQNVSDAFVQTDQVTIPDSVSENYTRRTTDSMLSQSLSTMSETGFSDAISKTNNSNTCQAVPKDIDLRIISQHQAYSPTENLVNRINSCEDSGILLRGSTAASEQNSLTLKGLGSNAKPFSKHNAAVLTPQSFTGFENDLTNMLADDGTLSESELVDSSPILQTKDAESNLSWSSESSESNLLTVRDLKTSYDDIKVQSENASVHHNFHSEITANCATGFKSQNTSFLPTDDEIRSRRNDEIERSGTIFGLDQASEKFSSTPTSLPPHNDPFLDPILHDFSHMSDLPILKPGMPSCIPVSKKNQKQNESVFNVVDGLIKGGSRDQVPPCENDGADFETSTGVKKTNFHDQSNNRDELSVDQIGRERWLQKSCDENFVQLENVARKQQQNGFMGEFVSGPNFLTCEENIEKTEIFKPKIICDKDINTDTAQLCESVKNKLGAKEATLSSSDEGDSSVMHTSPTLISSSECESANYLSSDDDVSMTRFDDDFIEPAVKGKLKPMLPIHLHLKDCEIPTTEWLVRLAVIRMRYCPLAFAFHQWMLLTSAKKWENEMIKHMSDRCNILAMRKHLRIWCKKHSGLLSSKEHSRYALLRRYFLQWLMWMKHKQDRKRMRQLAEQKYSIGLIKTNFEYWNLKLRKRNALLEILEYWQTRTKQHVSQKSKNEKNIERNNNELLLECFTRWKLRAHQIQMVDRYHKQTVTARFLRVWNDWASGKVSLLKRCEEMFNYHLRKKVLKSWLQHVLFMKNIYMMNRKAKMDFLSTLFSRWHEKTQVRKTHFSALFQLSLINRKNTVRDCFNKWRREQTKHKLADVMHRRSLMKKFVVGWYDATKKLVGNKLIYEAIGASVAKHSKQATLTIWRYEFQLTWKMSSVMQRFTFLTVRRVWRKWKEGLAVQRALRCYSIILRRRTLNIWKRFLHLKQNSDKRARTVLSLWHEMTKRNRNLSCMADQFISQSHTINLEIHFTTWLIACDQTKRAKNHNRNMILGRAFFTLHERSKQKKTLLRMRNNFMKQKTKELFAISWHTWKHRYRNKIKNVTSIEKHQIATECRILWKCWLLWKRRTLEMNATQIYKKSMIKMCFSKWILLHEKLRKADNLAKDHVQRRLKMILTQWWSHTQTGKNERQIVLALGKSRSRISTISLFMIWLKSSRNGMVARSFWERKNKQKAFQRLKKWKNESKRLKNCYDQAVQLVQTISLKFYFNQWKSMFRKVRMLEVTCDQMLEVKSSLTLKMLWKRWFKAKEKRDMHLRHEHVLASSAIEKWKKYAVNRVRKRLEKELRSVAIKQFQRKWLCKRAFTVWKNKHKVQTFALKSQKTTVNRYWNCWKTRTAMIIFAREVSKTWTVRKFWHSWRLELVTRNAIKDSVERINRDLVISVFRIWRAYRCKKKTGKTYHDAMSTGEVLTPRKRSRIPVLKKYKNVDC